MNGKMPSSLLKPLLRMVLLLLLCHSINAFSRHTVLSYARRLPPTLHSSQVTWSKLVLNDTQEQQRHKQGPHKETRLEATTLPQSSTTLAKEQAGYRRLLFKTALPLAAITLLLTAARPWSCVDAYRRLLATRPFSTQLVTGAVLSLLGDGLAQWRSATTKYDPARALSFATFDACYRAFQFATFPALIHHCRGHVLRHLWLFGTHAPALRWWAALEQTLVFQGIIIPLFYYPIFFAVTGLVQGLTARQSWGRARQSFWPCWKLNLRFWLPVQYYMFALLPAAWHIPFTCVMGVIWNIILSSFAGSANQSAPRNVK